MMTLAKGLTNGTVPASAVVMKKDIYDTFMTGPDWMVELTHGYTYSAHPLAVAAGLATLDLYRTSSFSSVRPRFRRSSRTRSTA